MEKRFDGSYGNNKVTNTSFDSQGFTDLSDNSSMRSFCHIRHSLVTELDQSRWLNESYVFMFFWTTKNDIVLIYM